MGVAVAVIVFVLILILGNWLADKLGDWFDY